MSSPLQPKPKSYTPVDLEPALSEFLFAISKRIQQSAGPNPTINTLRQSARDARVGWSLAGPKVPVVSTPDFGLPTRLFRPQNSEASPLLIYLHGGGWVMLDLDSHDRLMRSYALECGWSVLGLDYPLAPEVQFPQNLLACVDAVERIVQQAEAIGVLPDKIVLGGDSSGANLALSIALHRQSSGHPALAGLLLNYGVFDSDLTRPSYHHFGAPPYLLTRERIGFFWSNYCRSNADRTNPLASPLRTDLQALAGLPPVHLNIAGQDVLLDENLLLAAKLEAAGVDVSHIIYENAAHGFLEAVHCSNVADRAVADTASWLHKIRHSVT